MILVVLTEGGCWLTLNALRKYGWDVWQTERGEGGSGEAAEEMLEDRTTTDFPVVRE